MTKKCFEEGMRWAGKEAHQIAADHGFCDGEPEPVIAIALMHSELSEALEAVRCNLTSDHIPQFTGIEEEFADVVIRIMQFSDWAGLRLSDAILAKMEYNRGRPYKHGKRF